MNNSFVSTVESQVSASFTSKLKNLFSLKYTFSFCNFFFNFYFWPLFWLLSLSISFVQFSQTGSKDPIKLKSPLPPKESEIENLLYNERCATGVLLYNDVVSIKKLWFYYNLNETTRLLCSKEENDFLSDLYAFTNATSNFHSEEFPFNLSLCSIFNQLDKSEGFNQILISNKTIAQVVTIKNYSNIYLDQVLTIPKFEKIRFHFRYVSTFFYIFITLLLINILIMPFFNFNAHSDIRKFEESLNLTSVDTFDVVTAFKPGVLLSFKDKFERMNPVYFIVSRWLFILIILLITDVLILIYMDEFFYTLMFKYFVHKFSLDFIVKTNFSIYGVYPSNNPFYDHFPSTALCSFNYTGYSGAVMTREFKMELSVNEYRRDYMTLLFAAKTLITLLHLLYAFIIIFLYFCPCLRPFFLRNIDHPSTFSYEFSIFLRVHVWNISFKRTTFLNALLKDYSERRPEFINVQKKNLFTCLLNITCSSLCCFFCYLKTKLNCLNNGTFL